MPNTKWTEQSIAPSTSWTEQALSSIGSVWAKVLDSISLWAIFYMGWEDVTQQWEDE